MVARNVSVPSASMTILEKPILPSQITCTVKLQLCQPYIRSNSARSFGYGGCRFQGQEPTRYIACRRDNRISGDSSAANGLIAGCEVWYSVFGGLFPDVAKKITDAAVAGDHTAVRNITDDSAHSGSFFISTEVVLESSQLLPVFLDWLTKTACLVHYCLFGVKGLLS